MLKVNLCYPTLDEEIAIYTRFAARSPLYDLEAVVSVKDVFFLQETVENLYCAEAIRRYVALIASATREHPDLLLGVSPRGALMLMLAARGRALLLNRAYVLPDDVQAMLAPVLGHRLILRPEARLNQITITHVLDSIMRQIPVPEA